MTAWINLTVNGTAVELEVDPMRRLADVLRDDLGLTGTKIGCDAGDCGACTVRLDGRQVLACLVPVAQAAGSEVRTVEGLAGGAGEAARVRRPGGPPAGVPGCRRGAVRDLHAGDAHGRGRPPRSDAQPDRAPDPRRPGRRPVPLHRLSEDRRGGAAAAVGAAAAGAARRTLPSGAPSAERCGAERSPSAGRAVGARLPKVDGIERVSGTAAFGADARPAGILELRAVRSPHARARFTIGDLGPLHARHPGLVRVLTAADIPGQNRYGIYPTGKDQPALAEDEVRHRGEAVCALVAEEAVLDAIDDAEVPIAWEPLPPITGMDAALATDAPRLHDHAPGNVLIEGRVARGDVDAALAEAAVSAEVEIETTFVEHAYIEPEAGYARRIGDRIELVVSTQTPYMDRDEVALILGIAPDQVRIIPTACGGGFGGKLDLSVHPLVATAAWLLDRPVRAVWTRPESMAASPKRHPARIRATAAAGADGRLTAFRFHGDFDTGAYASWGPTVANRVPVHAMGPYAVPAVLATTRAIHTNNPPAGAFRGFGVPQAAIAHEALMDELAAPAGDGPTRVPVPERAAGRLDHRDRAGAPRRAPACRACLDALRPHWARLRAEARLERGRGGSRRPAPPGRRHRGDVVRDRQHLDDQPIDDRDRASTATAP